MDKINNSLTLIMWMEKILASFWMNIWWAKGSTTKTLISLIIYKFYTQNHRYFFIINEYLLILMCYVYFIIFMFYVYIINCSLTFRGLIEQVIPHQRH